MMRVLLVEPQYRRSGTQIEEASDSEDVEVLSPKTAAAQRNDDTLWYPPLGLMKLARFHKNRGDEVVFVKGCDRKIAMAANAVQEKGMWDRVYITTLFTFHWDTIVETILFYKEAVGGTAGKIFVGGIMASMMPDDLFEETGIYPVTGVIVTPKQIGLEGDVAIDTLPPDYSILDRRQYAINNTFYAYTSRGCVNQCGWCGVPKIEPAYQEYIDIKPMIKTLREEYGDKPRLKLMDNNVLASDQLERIVDDLRVLGYGRGQLTETKRNRVVDFNQGLDASFLDDKRMGLLASLNIKPMRIAFDRALERDTYVKALRVAKKYGVQEFSNYMLYNWKDTPRDLYERLIVNIEMNEEWGKGKTGQAEAEIYSYPMRFAPINNELVTNANRKRDVFSAVVDNDRNWLKAAVWTPRFVRNIEIMKGAAHGCISPTPTLAWRTIGRTYEEFLANLYMPEELLRNRNKHEKHVYKKEPKRESGSGKVEAFRLFISSLLKSNDHRFQVFHAAVSGNSSEQIRRALEKCKDKEIKEWLNIYLKK